jgi:histidine ammonia-lyase
VRRCREVLGRVRAVLAIEAVCAAQALDLRAPLGPGEGSAVARAAVRSVVPPLSGDRVIHDDLRAALALVEDERLLAAVESAVGPLD